MIIIKTNELRQNVNIYIYLNLNIAQGTLF